VLRPVAHRGGFIVRKGIPAPLILVVRHGGTFVWASTVQFNARVFAHFFPDRSPVRHASPCLLVPIPN